MRWLALIIWLALVTVASAQVPLPQNVPVPLVPNGLDATGTFTSRQITNTDILGPFPVSTSSNTAVLGAGQMILSLDTPLGFTTGQVVQVTTQADGQYLIGVITAFDPTTFNATINAIIPNLALGVYTGFIVNVIGGSNINGVPVWAGLSIDGVDSITYPTTAGAVMTLNVETGKAFSNFSTVYVWAPQDITTYAIGTVITYSPTTGAMQVFVKQASTTGLTYSTNYVSMIDTSAIDAALTNYSSTPYNGAASGNVSTPSTLKMTVSLPGSLVGGGSSSTPSQTLVANSVFPFTVVAGQYFPIQGNVLLDDLTPGVNNHYVGSVYSYVGTTLQLLIQSVFGTGSPSQAWGMYLIAGAQTRISLYQMNGLQVTGTAAGFTVRAGSVRDSTDTIDLILTASETATLVSTQMTGTAAVNGGGVVTGAGTSFTTQFSATAKLTDLNNQLANLGFPAITAGTIFGITTSPAVSAYVSSVASNTSMILSDGIIATSGNIYRGLPPGGGVAFLPQTWGIIIARQDSTGNCHTFQVSFTPSGVPDLPSGYTYYRVIAYSQGGGALSTSNIVQPLLLTAGAQSAKAVYSGTMQLAAVGITEASVNTTTGLVTMNVGALGAVPVVTGQSVVLTGTVSTGLTTGTAYYINVQLPGDALTGATFYLYTDQADAYAGGVTGRVIPSVNNNPGWSFRYFTFSGVSVAGLDANAPVGATPGSTTMHFDFNLTNSLAAAQGGLNISNYGMVTSGAAAANNWLVNQAAVFTSTTLVQLTGGWQTGGGTAQGTWAQQSTTNPITMYLQIWGALDEPIPANDNDLLERAVA